MILDEVLYESREFDTDSMVDMFVEGFLYALEMQEAGYKAGSTEELSKTIIEGADVAISELSKEYTATKANNAAKSAAKTLSQMGHTFEHGMHNKGFNGKKLGEKQAKLEKRLNQANKFARYSVNKAKQQGWN